MAEDWRLPPWEIEARLTPAWRDRWLWLRKVRHQRSAAVAGEGRYVNGQYYRYGKRVQH